MAKNKYIDIICIICIIIALTASSAFGKDLSLQNSPKVMGYENRIFNTSKVHTIDIVMDDWNGFLEQCKTKKYENCSVVIDGETISNVAIRSKGGSSFDDVKSSGSSRYSFKIEFDHNEKGKTYYGLDKLCLNNIIQDNTYMKDYLAYQMMNNFGVKSPLSSYVYITINGKDFGLYLAVEGLEDSFLQRSYGTDIGKFYKPGGGNDLEENENKEDTGEEADNGSQNNSSLENIDADSISEEELESISEYNFEDDENSKDVMLQYIDNNPESYPMIFNCSKVKVSGSDKNRLIQSIKKMNQGMDIESVVDVEAVMRYFVVHTFVSNGDSYTGSMVHNYYLYEKNGRMSMIPWDYNLGFGTLMDQDVKEVINQSIDNPIYSGEVSERPMFTWIAGSEKYREMYHQYYQRFIYQVLSNKKMETEIDKTAALISPYVEKDPTKFCTYDQFKTGVASIKTYFKLRTESVQNQLEGNNSVIDTSLLNLLDMGSQS